MDRRLILINCALILLTAAVGSVTNLISNQAASLRNIKSKAAIHCKENQFLPHETNCSSYYMCIRGELTLKHCDKGLFWAKDHCDFPKNSKCRPIQSTKAHKQSSGTSHSRSRTPSTDGKKVVCYFTNWAWYRQGAGKFLPEDINGDLCTHINYAFAVLDEGSLTLKPHDSWADIDSNFYKKIVSYKSKGIVVMIALGGWNDSLGKYSKLVNDVAARARFIEHVVQFIEQWGFDGIDLDWEYPKCWQNNCGQGPDSDKQAFTTFVKELKEAFAPKGWFISAAVSASKTVIDKAYDVPAISKYLDWINVMCYDYHGQWDKLTGHAAPFNQSPGDTDGTLNTKYSLDYWITLGADAKKLVMGMPTYGKSFTLANPNEHGLNAKSSGAGLAGDFTGLAGTLAFYEICTKVKRQSWSVVRDPEGRIGPYAYKENQWVGYDDIAEFKRKSQYVKANALGGGMIWTLDLDDFNNSCGCGRYPLLRMINHVIRDVPLENQLENCT